MYKFIRHNKKYSISLDTKSRFISIGKVNNIFGFVRDLLDRKLNAKDTFKSLINNK